MKIAHLEGTADAWTFRRFPALCADLRIVPRRVLHVGGHLGQEVEHYRAAGAEVITYMEPNPVAAATLRGLGPDVNVIEAAAGVERGTLPLFECGGDGAWHTLRRDIGSGPGVHQATGWIDVEVIPIRDVQGKADVIVVDTQGTEIEALMGVDWASQWPRLVAVETQSSGHPEAAHVRDVDRFMGERGWVPVHAWNHERKGRPHETFMDVFYMPAVMAP